MNRPFCDYFKAELYQKMLTPNGSNPVRNRADSLLKVFETLEDSGKSFYRILETGCMRADHGDISLGDDGASTLIFDLFLKHHAGFLMSLDINKNNIDYAKKKVSERVQFWLGDSVNTIWHIAEGVNFDLVYLDSFDITKDNPHPSQLHHLLELTAIMKNIKSGTIVMIDDHDAFFTGGLIGKGVDYL